MIGEIVKSVLITSIAGSVLAIVISLLRPITKKLFGYSWHYYIWLCVLCVMLMPVRFNLAPGITPQSVQIQQETVSEQSETTENIVQTDTAQKPQLLQKATVIWERIIYSRMNILAYLWLIGAVSLILLNISRYVRLNIQIRRNGEIISCPEISRYTDRKINVRVWENIASPFMTGIFRPTLILPKMELSDEQLHNILRHEMTHFKRHDILYKWFAELVKCVHWFNPIAWYISKQIAAECEISCDMAVTKNMSDSEEMSYINTILSLLPTGKTKRFPLTTQMAGSKKILKRRFFTMKNRRTTSRFMSAISAVIAVVMLSATVFASGALSGLTADDYNAANNGDINRAAPEYTIEQFFDYFGSGDFKNMKRYCTQNCIDDFYGDNYVFGMKKASLQNIENVPEDLAAYYLTEGKLPILVNVTMVPDENSVFEPNQTETSFYLILKQQNGGYLIDEFATGL